MTALPRNVREGGGVGQTLVLTVGYVGLGVLAFYLSVRTPSPSVFSTLSLLGFVAVSGWMFVSERYQVTLAVLAAYLGMLDGFLKLKTGSQLATLGRDLLLYAIVAGALVRFLLRKEPIRLPPLSGWILAFAMVVIVGIANPGSYPLIHGLASVRPHLEFVPLFFFGYLVMRNPARLRAFLVLLLVCGAANGVVGAIQFNLTPDQLAAWGPGYSKFIKGSGALAGR